MADNLEQHIAALQTQVVQGYERGDYTQALALAQEAYALSRNLPDPEHPLMATAMNALAVLYRAMGDYMAAQPLFEQALALRQRVLGPEHPDVAASLHDLAVLYRVIGNFAAAQPLDEQALALRQRVLGPAHPDVAASLHELAGIYCNIGNFAAAQSRFEQALALRQRVLGPDHPDVAATLHDMGWLYRTMGNFTTAQPLHEQALALHQRVLGPDHPNIARSLNGLAVLYHAMGDYIAAQSRFEQALALRQRVLGPDHPDVAVTLHNLATLYIDIGDYASAMRLFEQGLGVYRQIFGVDHHYTCQYISNFAYLYYLIGDYKSSQSLLEQALVIRRRVLGPDHPDIAGSLSNLARTYAALGDYEAALSLHAQALELGRRVFGADHPALAQSLSNLARTYTELGDYAAALSRHEQALALHQRVLGPDHPAIAESLTQLARTYTELGDYAAALSRHEQALLLRQRVLGPDHPAIAENLNDLARLCIATNRPHEGLTHMTTAVAIEHRMLGQICSCGSEKQRMVYLQTLQENVHAFLSLVLQHFSDTPAPLALALELVLRRKALGAEALSIQREVVLGGQYPALAPALHHLHMLRMQIAQRTLAGPGPDGLAAHQERLATWQAEQDRREAELARQIPEMNLERRLRAVDRQVVAFALPEAATLVEFVRFPVRNFRAVPAHGDHPWEPARYVAFVLPAGKPDHVQMIDLGAAEPIDQRIATYRDALTDNAQPGGQAGAALEPDGALGHALRAALFDPVARALPAGCQELFLAPDGAVSQLPFEVLPLDDGRDLIDTFQITYLSTGRDVLRFGMDVQTASTAPLIAADPDFDLASSITVPVPVSTATGAATRHSRDLQRDGRRFTRLSGTAVEGERIAALLGVTPWLAATVVETPLKACRAPRILHLATHGGFLPAQPHEPNTPQHRLAGPGMENPMLRSFLVLAGVNTWLRGGVLPAEAEDGMLTAEDVSGMQLLGTELVVLSACDTGRGAVQTGEGVLGLRRAFVLAGAQTLVMSLWSVPDIATAILMEQFYRHLLQGQGRAEALRHAQHTLRQMTVGQLRHDWLSPAMITRLAAGDLDVEFDLEALVAQPDDHCPFNTPRYWGGFICQGMPGPLRAVSGPEHATS